MGTCVADPDPVGHMDPDLIMSVGSETDSDKQCCGSVTFGTDQYLCRTDPDADPEEHWQKVRKKLKKQ
jgi:hypothetical protein